MVYQVDTVFSNQTFQLFWLFYASFHDHHHVTNNRLINDKKKAAPSGKSLSCQSSSRPLQQAQFHKCFHSISLYFPVGVIKKNIIHTEQKKMRTGVIMLKLLAHCFGITDGSFQEGTVAIQKLAEGVAHRISSFPDPDGLHHTRVTELTNAQLSVEQLRHRSMESDMLTPFVFGKYVNMFYFG